MSKRTLAGAVALLAAPIIVIAGTLAQPTLSDDAASQVAALTDHRGAMITSTALSTIAVVLLIGGLIWFALALAPAPRGWPWPAAYSAYSASPVARPQLGGDVPMVSGAFKRAGLVVTAVRGCWMDRPALDWLIWAQRATVAPEGP